MANWQMRVTRLGYHRHGGRIRTYGSYKVSIDGRKIKELTGFVCEAPGPGDISEGGLNKVRITPGEYSLHKHDTDNYSSSNYVRDIHAIKPPLPGIRLQRPEMMERNGILIHPGASANPRSERGMPISDLFLSSRGCLNLTGRLAPDQDMNFWESRGRVIALLASLRSFDPEAFDAAGDAIPHAIMLIEGEPDGDYP